LSGAVEGGAGRGATILVVEDEDLVRDLAQEILAGCGYRVLVAAHAGGALAAAAAAGGIDLLVTDLVLPGSSGGDLAEELSRRDPGLQVLFMSGYSDSDGLRLGEAAARASFLQKPFSPEQLERRVRELLGA